MSYFYNILNINVKKVKDETVKRPRVEGASRKG